MLKFLFLGIRVEGFMGSISPQGGIKVADIGVATIEKANGIVNRLDAFNTVIKILGRYFIYGEKT